jgi:hypothetical protein
MIFLWPSGWRWQPNQPEYEQMILGVYATLGIFLLIASRNPSANRSLIAFTAWSSLVHAAIMAVQAFQNASERGHLLGDLPQFFRCEAPFLLRHELECTITPSAPAQKALTPPRLRASWQAPPTRHCSDPYGHTM